MRFKLIYLLIIALTIHIFSVHCRLLYYLNPELETKPPFSFINLNESTNLAMVFAISYSLATSFIIFNTKRKKLVLIYGLLDAIGVLLYYNTKLPLFIGAIYFSFYTGLLVYSTYYLNNPGFLYDKILGMKANGITQRDIASKLNISESKVSRVLKGVNITKGKNHKSDLG